MQTREELWTAYRLRWKRRRLLFRALRKRRQLKRISDKTKLIASNDILVASTVRNEIIRLPFFLDHHRKLGVSHFLFVDNGSDDGTLEYLAEQPDVSVWQTTHSYKSSRFGVDWLTWLQIKYAHDHWCLTLDADELFIYPFHDTRNLRALTKWLEVQGADAFGALMLDMYPKGPVDEAPYTSGTDPTEVISWFDGGNYMIRKKEDLENLWIQGGVRARMFFAQDPKRAPTMGKTPLVKWNRRFAYVSSTHTLLPRRLNHVYAEDGGELTSGALLHTKFLDIVSTKAREEKHRQEHFENSALYGDYYDSLIEAPDLWCDHSTRYLGWRQLEAMGLMSRGGWP